MSCYNKGITSSIFNECTPSILGKDVFLFGRIYWKCVFLWEVKCARHQGRFVAYLAPNLLKLSSLPSTFSLLR